MCRPIRKCYIHVLLCHRCRGKNHTPTFANEYDPSNQERDVTEISIDLSRWNLRDLAQETIKETADVSFEEHIS